MSQQNLKFFPGLPTLKEQAVYKSSIMPLEGHPKIKIVFDALGIDTPVETNVFYFQGQPLMRLSRFVLDGADHFQIQPLFSLDESDKDRFWQIKLILKEHVRKYIFDLDLNKVANDLWKKNLDRCYGKNLSQEEIHYDYFLRTLKSFETNFDEFRLGKNGKQDIESEPDSDSYSHVRLFSLIYDLQYRAIENSKIQNPSILDVGCGMGFQLLLFQKLFKASKIMGTDIDINRFQHAVQDYEQALKAQGVSYNPLLLEKNDFLAEGLEGVLKKNQLPKGMADIVLINHVLEHLEQDPILVLEILLKSTGKMLMISVPFEKVPNTDSGHHRVFGKKYLTDIAHQLKYRHPELKINLSHADVGMLIIEKP